MNTCRCSHATCQLREKHSKKGTKLTARKKKITKEANLISSRSLGSEITSEETQLPDMLGLEPVSLFHLVLALRRGWMRCGMRSPRLWTRTELDLPPGSLTWLGSSTTLKVGSSSPEPPFQHQWKKSQTLSQRVDRSVGDDVCEVLRT